MQAGVYGGGGWGDAHVSPQFTNPTKVGYCLIVPHLAFETQVQQAYHS